MKHSKFMNSKYAAKSLGSYLSDLFNGLFKTGWSVPKSVWYSLRYNSGEKFLQNTPYMYPYRYPLDINKSKEPVVLSNQLANSIDNFQAETYEKLNLENPELVKVQEEFVKIFNTSFYELYKSFEYNTDNKNFDVPVVVSAKTLYGAANFKIVNSTSNPFKKMEFSDIKIQTLSFILDNFMKKLQYSDSESICQVLYTLDQFSYYHEQTWNKLINELKSRSFEPEFTKVKSIFPLYFRYKNVNPESLNSVFLDKNGNDLFIHGFKPLLEAKKALQKANTANNKIDSHDILKSFNEKFPQLNDLDKVKLY
jgi:hypothetical protein